MSTMRKAGLGILAAAMAAWAGVTAARAADAGGGTPYKSLEDLMQDFQKKQGEAVKAYLAARPDAADADRARQMVVMLAMSTGDFAGATKILAEQYKAVAALKGEANLRTDFARVVDPLFTCYIRSGKKAEAKNFIERVRNDFETHAEAAQIGKMLQRMEKQLNRPAVGDALPLKFDALDGRKVDVAALKGKVVLVDFWATWCGPCRTELPFVKEAYKKYHEKGFEIVGISLDEEKSKLDEYLKKEDVPWPQYFTGDGWETDLAQKYGISSIPATFLIGPEGEVVATDLRGKALEAKIGELLK